MNISTEIFFFIIPTILILIAFVIETTGKILKSHIGEVLFFISGYILFLVDIRNDSDEYVLYYKWNELTTVLIIIGVIVGISAIIISAIQKDNLRSKQSKKIQNEYYKFCSDFIRESFKVFFENSHNNGRVSMYLHKNDRFYLIGRFSNSPKYNTKSREHYPDDQGLISKGWQEGVCMLNEIPEWRGEGAKYFKKLNDYKTIPKEVVKKIRMKSRSFYIKRIENEDSRLPHGIIVMEKMNPKPISNKIIMDIFDKESEKLKIYFKGLKSI